MRIGEKPDTERATVRFAYAISIREIEQLPSPRPPGNYLHSPVFIGAESGDGVLPITTGRTKIGLTAPLLSAYSSRGLNRVINSLRASGSFGFIKGCHRGGCSF